MLHALLQASVADTGAVLGASPGSAGTSDPDLPATLQLANSLEGSGADLEASLTLAKIPPGQGRGPCTSRAALDRPVAPASAAVSGVTVPSTSPAGVPTNGVEGLSTSDLQWQLDALRAEQAARAGKRPALTVETSAERAPFSIPDTLPAGHPIRQKAAKAAQESQPASARVLGSRAVLDHEADVGLACREASNAQHTLGALHGQLQKLKDETCEQAAVMRSKCERACVEQDAAARAWERRRRNWRSRGRLQRGWPS